MYGKTTQMIMIAAALALAACQQPAEKSAQEPAPQAEAPAAKPEATAPMTAKPAVPASKAAATTPAPAPETSTAMTAKPVAPAPKAVATTPPPAPKPEASTAMTAKPATPAPASEAVASAMRTFSTMKCMACHAIDDDKVGPAWKTVVEKYGDAATLARDFEAGFKERRVANSIAKWKSKEGLMTAQYRNLIKGHEKEAAHALFESVKNGKFGSY
jgi:cytochrome c551/c552